MIRRNKMATLIEVKSADNVKSKSMESMIKNYGVKKAIRLSAKANITCNDVVETYPLYMAMFL